MVEFILKIIIAVFCIIGLADSMHFFKGLILKPNKKFSYAVNIELFSNQIEQLNSILDEYRWSKTVKAENIRIICRNITEEDFAECKRLAKIYGVMIEKSEF